MVNDTVSNVTSVKITGTGEDLSVYLTDLGVEAVIGTMKYILPEGDVIIYTDGNAAVNSVLYVELRSLQNVPSGYVLVRNGDSEAEFTVSASGTVSIWFDEEHDTGDVDLFIFDSSNPDYSSASTSQSWFWLATHSDAYIFSDTGPSARTVTASGTLKFIVKTYSGTAPSWRVALQASTSPTPTPTPTPTASPTPTPEEEESLLGQIQGAIEGNSSVVLIVLALLLLLIIVLVARGPKKS